MNMKKLVALTLSVMLIMLSAVIPASVSATANVTEYLNISLVDGKLVNTIDSAELTVDGRLTPSAATNPYTGAEEFKIAISAGGSGWPTAQATLSSLPTTGKTVWYEYDLRTGASVPDFRIIGLGYATYTVLVEGSGKVQLGHFNSGYVGGEGTIAPNSQYKIVVAVDYITNAFPTFTLWINGVQIGSNGSSSWAIGTGLSTGLQFFPAAKDIYVSGAKVYTTDTAATAYNPMSIYDGATVTSTDYEVDAATSKIKVAPGTKLGDLASKLTAANGLNFLAANGSAIAESDWATTDAIGNKVLAVANNGTCYKTYDIVSGDALYYIDGSSVTWLAKTGEAEFATVTAASQVLKGDKLKLSFDMVNNTAENKTFALVVAVYNDDRLIGYSITENITIESQAVSGTPETVELATPVDVTYDDNYYLSHNITARAFLWDSAANETSVMAGLSLS